MQDKIRTASCFLCGCKTNLSKCEKCQKIYSCSQHFEKHFSGSSCLPVKVSHSSNKGHFLVATRFIEPGEIVLQETAAVTGPSTKSRPQCLECCRIITSDKRIDCRVCRFPFCSAKCTRGPVHINNECRVFKNAKFRANISNLSDWNTHYSAIIVLRLLLLLENNAFDYKDVILCMEDHDEKRRNLDPETWNLQKLFIVDFIQKNCKLERKYSEDYIRKLIGVVMTNTTNLQLKDTTESIAIGLFPFYAMGNHSCKPNVKTIIGPDKKLNLVSLTTILPGDEVNSSYTSGDHPTAIRRDLLRQSWYFDCSCRRCADPQECGSSYSSLICNDPKCRGELIVCEPLEFKSDSFCNICRKKVAFEDIAHIVSTAQIFINQFTQNPLIETYEEAIYQLSDKLHSGHYLMIELKTKLSDLYGNNLLEMSNTAKRRKLQLILDILHCFENIQFSVSASQVMLYSELLKIQEAIARDDFKAGKISKNNYDSIVMKAKQKFVKGLLKHKNKFKN